MCLVAVLLLAFTFRLLPVSSYYNLSEQSQRKIAYFSDAGGYAQYARFISSESWSLFTDSVTAKKNSYTAFRTPLYPLFISKINDIFGTKPLPVILIQICLDTITTLFVFKIALAVFKKEKTALLAAFFYAISPLAVMFSSSIYAESFFTFFFTLTLLVFVWSLEKQKYRYFVLAGFLLGLSTLIKPVSFYFVTVLAIVILCTGNGNGTTAGKKIKMILTVFFAFCLTIAPWQARNLYLFGHYSLTFQQGGELLAFNVGTCQAWEEHVNPQQVYDTIEQPYANIFDPFTRSAIEQKDAIDFMLTDTSGYIGCEGEGISHFFFTPNIFADRSSATRVSNTFLDSLSLSQKTEMQFSTLYLILLYGEYAILLAGLALLIIRKKNVAFAVLVLLTVMYFSVCAGVEGYYRYRYPVTPIIAVALAASLFELAQCKKLLQPTRSAELQ